MIQCQLGFFAIEGFFHIEIKLLTMSLCREERYQELRGQTDGEKEQ